MVQGIRPGKPQVTLSSKSSQPSLFGNGQAGAYSNEDWRERSASKPRNVKEEEARAKQKFAQTAAGKAAAKSEAKPKAAAAPKGPPPVPAVPCHHKHPPYPVAENFTVIGGSGITPFVKDCDIYCSLDKAGPTSMPWEANGPYCFVFEIKNYGVPYHVEDFKKLVTWLAAQIKAGRRVHVGCMAGHGRTGMVLAALRMEMAGDKDAIMHVRNNYCDQAVETDAQIKWLVDHYGVNVAPPRKEKYRATTAKVSATEAGAVRHGDWATYGEDTWDTGFDPANVGRFDNIPREAHHTSWVANSPWLIELEGPPANLGDTPWYDDDVQDI